MRSSDRDDKRTTRHVGQLIRFALVGFSNTAVDLGVTNLLVVLTAARSEIALLLVSVVACSTATFNSYLLNRRFTFRDADGQPVAGSVVRFAAVAGLSMIVNTSVFLFLAKYMPPQLGLPELAAINLAKIGGIAAAMAVSFAGYRFGVFRTDAIKAFRESFRFTTTAGPSLALQLSILATAAIAVRLGYLALTTAIFGDAVNYSRVAGLLASGNYSDIDAFWSNLFCFWQAGFHMLGLETVAATLAASLVPGIALVVPVVWMARSLFGPRVAWLAGALTVVHPRLVEYSCNGYAESFYLFAFACGIAFLVAVVRNGSVAAAAGWGVSFGVYAAVRPEAVAAFLASALLAFVLTWWASRERSTEGLDTVPPRRWMRTLRVLTAGVIAFVVTVGSYAAVSRVTLGAPAVLQKAGNLGKQYSEQLDWEHAAKETYGSDGKLLGPPADAPRLSTTARVLLQRFPRNLLYSLERLPGVLVSPVIVFALLMPVFVRRTRGGLSQDAVVAWMALFPILLYPLIQVEPRLFFSLLIPVHIFGAAGVVAFTRYAGGRSGPEVMYRVVAVVLVVFSLGVTAWRGVAVERGYGLHRQLAGWIDDNVADDEVLVGCGYGHVSTTAFLTGNPAVARLWTNDAAELAPFVRARSAVWLLVYQTFIDQANPELRGVFDAGIPGFELAFEAVDTRGRRGQVYTLSVDEGPRREVSRVGSTMLSPTNKAERFF